MKHRAATKEEAAALTYGPSYRKVPYVSGRCCAAVWSDIPHGFHQCARKDGHGIYGTVCKQHALKEVPKKEDDTK